MDQPFIAYSGPAGRALVRDSVGFDLEAELALCRRLVGEGGTERVREVFAPWRAARLFQALLSTGRYEAMDAHWRNSIEIGVQRGSLAPPEWN